MDVSNAREPNGEIGNQIRVDIYRIPKKNHDEMVQNQKEFTDAFKKHGGYYQSFQLSNTAETSEGFTSMTTVLSTDQDEEVWMDLESYRDGKHMEDVISAPYVLRNTELARFPMDC